MFRRSKVPRYIACAVCTVLLSTVALHIYRSATVTCDPDQYPMTSDEQWQKICQSYLLDPNEVKQQQFAADKNVCQLTPSWYENSSCSAIRANYITDVNLLPFEELSISVGFGILMYKDVWQFERLLRAIYRPHHFYCIHLDAKTQHALFVAVERITSCFGNVFLAQNRVDVGWGTGTQVDAELSCMQELLERSSKWSWFINLTGQEFPLRTMWELVRVLHALNGTNSIQVAPQWFANERRKLPLRPFTEKHDMVATIGSTHIVAVRGFVQYAVNDMLAQGFHDFVVNTNCPDESFFNTLNSSPRLNIPGAVTVVQDDINGTHQFINRLKRFWNAKDKYPPCRSNLWRHDVCIFGVADLPFITSPERRELFVNKLYWDFQHYALDCLEWWYSEKTRSQYELYRTEKLLPVLPLDFYRQYSQQFRPQRSSTVPDK